MRWAIYILLCGDRTLYTGITTDITRRVSEHRCGARGAKYTRAKKVIGVVHLEYSASRSEALMREAEIKKLSHQKKRILCKMKS